MLCFRQLPVSSVDFFPLWTLYHIVHLRPYLTPIYCPVRPTTSLALFWKKLSMALEGPLRPSINHSDPLVLLQYLHPRNPFGLNIGAAKWGDFWKNWVLLHFYVTISQYWYCSCTWSYAYALLHPIWMPLVPIWSFWGHLTPHVLS